MLITAQKNNKEENYEKDGRIPFIISSSYLLTFLFIRLAVMIAGSAGSAASTAAKTGDLQFYIGSNIILFGYHIHHLYIGIFLIALAGWFSITRTEFIDRRDNALIYGIGLGLFMDEIGLLLSGGDYWHSTTYLLSLLLGGIFLNIIFFPDFWKDLRSHLGEFNPKNKILRHYKSSALISGVDKLADEADKTGKVTLVFSGLIYIIVGMLIISNPELVYYWVAGGFFLQGLTKFVEAWKA
ncbi:hypothetical protein DFR79_10747 [Halanaerobium saccharolyticum]|uniref:Uncharacterized protein n=1 Tax=Halanaerobium saccharolyticum TaxID=43595 RepID=A0A4V3CF27_9FIRM|nr:hypothetical protein [Halanaerobium saccharolyticum]TDO92142.1 hypothetical protein DFR79_10747 [Halanaerobium saccharolyticum]